MKMPLTTVEQLIEQLPLDEKVSLPSGADGLHSQNVVRLGVESIKVRKRSYP